MKPQRIARVNSLLKEVLAEVIRKDVHNPHVSPMATVTRVEVTKDLRYAKVYVSIIGSEKERAETLKALETAAGFIAITASKKVTIRYFPELTFKLDDTVDKQMRIEEVLQEIHAKEEKLRPSSL